jgi:transposase
MAFLLASRQKSGRRGLMFATSVCDPLFDIILAACKWILHPEGKCTRGPQHNHAGAKSWFAHVQKNFACAAFASRKTAPPPLA